MGELIQKQLAKITEADLSNFNPETNTYFIPKKKEMKIEEDGCYLIHCKSTLFNNQALKMNWNRNILPSREYLVISVSQLMGKMIKVDSIGYDIVNQTTDNYRWSGWLTTGDIEVLQKM